MHEEVDVVVVGMGSGGLAAAITAHDAGAEVLVLEKTPQHHAGGNSRVSGQVWFSPHDVEAAKRHLRAMCGDYPIPEDVVDAWATETSRNTEWVAARAAEVRGRVPKDEGDPYDGDGTDLAVVTWGDVMRAGGIPNPPEHEYPEVEGNECGSGYHMIAGTMGHSRLWLTLRSCAEDRGIPVRYEARVRRLVQEPEGRVSGVVVQTPDGEETIRARKGVILVSGGFAANPEMTRNYLRLSHAIPWGSPHNTGDGIVLAQSVGAYLAHPYNYMASPGIAMPPYPVGQDAMPRGRSFLCVARDGTRFHDETASVRHGKNPVRGTMDFHPGVPMWTVFDERTRLAGPLVAPRAFFPIDWMRQTERYDWSLDNSAEIERGWITRADTVRELAERLGLDPDGLERQVAEFNEQAESGTGDSLHGRPAATMAPLVEPPFYGYEWAQLLITTLGGIRKDGNARAVDAFGEPIEGLYCAGDVASTYSWALSGGMGLGDAMAFGRIAGRHAVAQA